MLADVNATHIVLGFDYEASDNSSSDMENGHKVYYTVMAITTNTTVDINLAKTQFRQRLPTGNFLFGFDTDEVAAADDAAFGYFHDIVAVTEGPVGDNFGVAASNGTEKQQVEYQQSVIMQYSSSDEFEAEMGELKKLWSNVTGTEMDRRVVVCADNSSSYHLRN